MLISKFDTTDIEQKIQEFEYKHNISLPNSYRHFLEKYNGGRTPKTEFKIGKVSSDVRAFYGLGEVDRYYRFDAIVENGIIDDFLDENMLPIATTVWGDYIIVGIGKLNYGKIYFLYHDRKRKYIPLCKDIKEFFSKCKSEKVGHVKTIFERKQIIKKNGIELTEELLKGWQAEIDEYANIHQEEVVL